MDEVKITFSILITTDSKGTAMSPLEGVKKSIGTISMDNGTHEINFHLPEVRQSPLLPSGNVEGLSSPGPSHPE
ncbi:hypothetical protein DPMN_007546 [Dreissena polymorpha]|uniref:Uncharacterized protein n=1 Tax=Dreissena polymorpha TaxID=45954 RepID=A0A9D4MX72_DREPO|nr:hypothetical protein DPMN_007546 [Dreissena polymorpha]